MNQSLPDELLAFTRTYGGRVMALWPDTSIKVWFYKLAEDGDLVVVRDDLGRVAGFGVGWLCERTWIQKQDNRPWAMPPPSLNSGSCFYFAQLVVRDAEAFPALIEEWKCRWPGVEDCELWAHRRTPNQPASERGRLRRLDLRTLQRLAHCAPAWEPRKLTALAA